MISLRLAAVRRYLGIGIVLPLISVGCQKPAEPAAPAAAGPPVLAQVEDSVITVAQFEAELARRAQRGGGRVLSAQEREALLDEMIRFEVSFAQAKAAGLDRDPEMIQRFRRMVVARYEEQHQTDTEKVPAPTAAEVEAYYRDHLAEFNQPEKVRGALLFLKVSPKAIDEKKREAMQRAERIRAEAIQQSSVQPSFGDLARQHSEDAATRYHGGDGGWMTRGQKSHAWPQEVMTALFALKAPGEISPVIPAPEGLYLVKLMERTEAAAAPLEQVRERIAWRLHQDRVQRGQKEFYERQKAGLRVTVHRDLLETIKLPSPPAATTPEAPPPALPRP